MRKKSRTILILLTAVNLFAILDRYILPSVQVNIQREMGLSDGQVGSLTSLFSLLFAFGSPLWGIFGVHLPRKKTLLLSGVLWAGATVLTGFAHSFYGLLLCRLIFGVGEVAFSITNLMLLSDLFSEQQRVKAIGIFLLSTPIGAAAGFTTGSYGLKHGSWSLPFFLAGSVSVVTVLVASQYLPSLSAQAKASEQAQPFRSDLLILAAIPSYRSVLLAGISLSFAMSGFSTWLPTYLHRYGTLSVSRASLRMGQLTFVCGLIGIGVGAMLTIFLQRRFERSLPLVTAFGLAGCAASALVTLTLTPHLITAGITVAELCLFSNAAAINAALLASVPRHLQTRAVAIYASLTHVFGDTLAPIGLGTIADHSSLKVSFASTAGVLMIGAVGLVFGSSQTQDYRAHEESLS